MVDRFAVVSPGRSSTTWQREGVAVVWAVYVGWRRAYAALGGGVTAIRNSAAIDIEQAAA